MPEGHTIHALAQRLERAFAGEPIEASSPQGRFAAGAERLDGRRLDRAQAVGKHLFVEFGDDVLHVHLGLIGSFVVKPLGGMSPEAPRGALRLRLVGSRYVADLRGAIVCELIDRSRRDDVVARLGPDPLDPAADSERAWQRIHNSRKPIGELLMDQAVVAGVGNVYRCEVLHRHRVQPFTPGQELKRATWLAIWHDLQQLMPLGVAFSQILTLPEQVDEAQRLVGDGSAGPINLALTGERLGDYFERRFAVYQRTGQVCPRCSKVIREREIAGRRLYWCANCQRRT